MDIQTSPAVNSSITTSSPFMIPSMTPEPVCRERHGEYSVALYNLVTCALCFKYVFSDLNVSIDWSTLELVTGTNTAYPEGTRMTIDMDNATAVSVICGSLLEPTKCWMWQNCCEGARRCCQRQIAEGPRPHQEYGKTLCPRTWDGFACWPDTPAGQQLHIGCPAYVPGANTGNLAYKTCTKNATWYVKEPAMKEWTDYTDCTEFTLFKRMNDAGLACNIITIVLIVPACIIFLYFKPLRQQNRIRLHLCLMMSSFVTSVSMLMWELIVFKDRLESYEGAESTMHQNSIGCRMLYVFTRYTNMVSFMWMFIEGFYLHRLLVHAFSVPKSLLPYYIFGFGFPVLPITVYAIIRGEIEEFNERCWIPNANSFEWILYVPILIALSANFFFLVRIVFIMVRQLEPHPNEPSNFRRALKAVGVLVPLFGVQFVLFAYRPEGHGAFPEAYELLNKIVSSLQGAFIALIFCFFNKEVQGHLKTPCMRVLRRSGLRREFSNSRSYTMTTQYATDTSRVKTTNGNSDSSHMIPLRPIYCPKNGEEANAKDMNRDLMNGNLNTIPEYMDEELPLNPSKNNS